MKQEIVLCSHDAKLYNKRKDKERKKETIHTKQDMQYGKT